MKAESTARRWISAIAAGISLAACGSDAPSHATVVEPSFDQPCRYAQCSDHGQCGKAAQGGPMCLCNVGYAGAHCTTCEKGFHLDTMHRCAPDRSCDKQPSNPCGPNGSCNDSDGVIMCDCDLGYEGPRCTLCRSGFGRNQYGECLMLVLGGSGGTTAPPPTNTPPDMQPGPTEPPTTAPALCTADSCNARGTCDGQSGRIECGCTEGYSGTRCASCADQYRRDAGDACVPFDKCADSTCGAHGGCDDAGGVIKCTCDAGYAGDACADCAPGFHQDSTDCALDEQCLANSCATHGTCAQGSGSISCACSGGYSGANCQLCASGYHRNAADDTCVINEVCGSTNCGAHGTCDASSGIVVCNCDAGYDDRQKCGKCAAGFHDGGGGACVLNEQCQPGSCSVHSTCDESSGVVACSCNTGYRGTKCEACATGYYRNQVSDSCVVFDCHNNPIAAAGLMTFEDVLWFPNYANNCGTKADLDTADVQLSSISGDGDVWSCAKSDIYGLSSRHALLEAGSTGPAALTFSGPISTLAFDYGAKSELTLEVLADGAVISTLSAARKSHASLSFTFDAPITVFALRSTTTFTNEIGLDNIAYAPPACP